jgi:hypothetical protein
MLGFSGDHRDVNHVRVLTSILIKLEKLQTNILHAEEIVGNQ